MNQSIKTPVYIIELAKDPRNDMVIVKEMIKKNACDVKAGLVPPPGVRGQAVLNKFNSFPNNPGRVIKVKKILESEKQYYRLY